MAEHEPTLGGSNFFGDCEADVARMDWEGTAQLRLDVEQRPSSPITQPINISLEDEISRLESEGGRVSPCD